MRTLSRKIGESVVLFTSDGPVTVTLTETSRNLAFTFDAPDTVEIVRSELMTQDSKKGKTS